MSIHAIDLPGFHAYAAEKIDAYRRAKRWTQETLTKKFNNLAATRYPRNALQMSRESMARLLALRKGTKRCRRQKIDSYQLAIFAELFDTSVAHLMGVDAIINHSQLDPSSGSEELKAFYTLLGEHLRKASELRGWGEFFPCSLVPQDFMHAHHRSLFDFYTDDKTRQIAVQYYDEIGNTQRARLYEAASNRPWTFTHLMFEKDLSRITDPNEQDYSACTKQQRLDCFETLLTLLTKVPPWNINVWIMPQNKGRQHRQIQDLDSLVLVFDQDGNPTFSFSRNHSGRLTYTTAVEPISANLTIMRHLQDQARRYCQDSADTVLELIKQYRDRAKALYC